VEEAWGRKEGCSSGVTMLESWMIDAGGLEGAVSPMLAVHCHSVSINMAQNCTVAVPTSIWLEGSQYGTYS
jgi:hypothetical protein